MTFRWRRITKTIFSKRYGVDLLRFTHHPDCVIFSSLNDANDRTCNLSYLLLRMISAVADVGGLVDRIRYHSLFDNKFLRYYSGHTERYVANGSFQ
jgi:COMPASS component SWD2